VVGALGALALAGSLKGEETLAAPFVVWLVSAPLAVLSAVGFADSWRASHGARRA